MAEHPDRFLPPEGQIKVRANPHFSPGFSEGVQCGDVLYIAADLHRRLATLTPEARQEFIKGMDVMIWPALSRGGETPLLAVPKLRVE